MIYSGFWLDLEFLKAGDFSPLFDQPVEVVGYALAVPVSHTLTFPILVGAFSTTLAAVTLLVKRRSRAAAPVPRRQE